MYSRCLILTFFLGILSSNLFGQIGSTIPSSRITDWDRSGYLRSPVDNIPVSQDACNTLIAASPNGINDAPQLESILNQASNDPCIIDDEDFVLVQLDVGNYRTNKIIDLPSNVVLKGKGVDLTKLIRTTGASSSTILRTLGTDAGTYEVELYNSIGNYITLNTTLVEAGDYLDIQVKHPNWAQSSNSVEIDVLGQVVMIKSVDTSSLPYKYFLDDDFSFVWDTSNAVGLSDSLIATKLNMITNTGIEDLNLVNESNDDGYLIHIVKSNNVWINSVRTFNAVSSHINIVQSTQIELRDNHIHGAKDFGVGGKGYGVSVSVRTTNSLIENNIFQRLRSCINISRGANRNVFGYNYCRDQTDTIGNKGSDISIHGNFPFLNLMEGNIVSKIHLDDFHGFNGPYNTFFRNFAYFEKLDLMETDGSNFLGNEFRVYNIEDIDTDISENIFDSYDSNNRKHIAWQPSFKYDGNLTDKSYYHASKPSFLTGYSWPPIGPRVSGGTLLTNDLPARDLYCSWYNERCEDRFFDIAVLKPGSDPALINGMLAFKKRITSWHFDYMHDFSYWVNSSEKSFFDINAGDFSGDGIDDLLVIAANDSDENKNRIIGWPSHGTGFSTDFNFPKMFDFTYTDFPSYNFEYLSAGNFDNDGLIDLALVYSDENASNPTLKNGVLLLTANPQGGLFKNEFINTNSFSSININGITSNDFNQDGLSDIAFISSNKFSVYESSGNSLTFMTDKIFQSEAFKGITSGDYNGDGVNDIAVFRKNSTSGIDNEVCVFTSTGLLFELMTCFTHDLSGAFDIEDISSGDFNNDGITDISFYRRNSTGTTIKNRIVIYTSDGQSFSFFSSFYYGGYDFFGVTSGRFGDLNKGKSLTFSEDQKQVPQTYSLANYPNPFNPSTNIVMSLPTTTGLTIEVFNVLGQKVQTLFQGRKDQGIHEFILDGSSLSSGIYLVRAQYDQGVLTQKVMLVK